MTKRAIWSGWIVLHSSGRPYHDGIYGAPELYQHRYQPDVDDGDLIVKVELRLTRKKVK